MKPFPTVHRVASQGYIIYEYTKKLKPEFQGLPSHVIAQKVRDGEEINDIQEIPSIAYTGMDKTRILTGATTIWPGSPENFIQYWYLSWLLKF